MMSNHERIEVPTEQAQDTTIEETLAEKTDDVAEISDAAHENHDCGGQNACEEAEAEETQEMPSQEMLSQEVSSQETASPDIPLQEEALPCTKTPRMDDMPANEAVPSQAECEPLIAAVLPYHERYYLRYGGKYGEELDIKGTKSFLQGLGFCGGELEKARHQSELAKNIQNEEKGNLRCSYCGAEISGVEFHRLPDGRTRCTTCNSTIVKTKADAEEICRRVAINMENFFGAAINVPVSIKIVDERKLKRHIGVKGGAGEQGVLILGVAINKKNKFSIILENGAPRISLIATFAHELTHIWQYTHWDIKKGFKKCNKKRRLLIYEGMAKWAEIQYLYLVGESAVARREEYITRNRKDEYGIGFRMYEDAYPLSRETMICDQTPFIAGGYPIE